MAGMAMGFSTAQTYRHVLLPRAYRIIWPRLTMDLTIDLSKLTAQANAMQVFSFQVFEAFAAALTIYLVLNMSLLFIMRKIERRITLPRFGI